MSLPARISTSWRRRKAHGWSPTKSFKCADCGGSFDTANGVAVHRASAHDDSNAHYAHGLAWVAANTMRRTRRQAHAEADSGTDGLKMTA